MLFDEFRQNARDGWRSLRRRPLTSLAAMATLAAGIGLNAAVFSVFDWVLLRPLPYPSSHELIRIFTGGTDPVTEPAAVTYAEFLSFAEARGFRAAAAFSTATRVMAGQGIEPLHVDIARVSGDLFAVLGVAPTVGRAFAADEVSSGAAVVILSEEFWRRTLHGDAAVVGRPLTIDGQLHRVVGVMPAGRGYPINVNLWRPLTLDEREDDDREHVMIVRRQSATSIDRASLEIATLAAATSDGHRTAWAEDLHQTHVRGVSAALLALVASAALILLMTCANVAALVGSRGAERAREMAVRGALGASRNRLLRQMLTENVLLAVAGGAAGLLLGQWALDLLVSLAPGDLPRLAEISLDRRIVGIGAGATLIVGVVTGLVPSFRASRSDVRGTLAVVSARTMAPPNRGGLLVAVQTAMAIVLVITAGLLARTLQNLVVFDHGFIPERLIAVDLYLRGGAGGDLRQLFRALVATAEAAPGVRSAAVALRLPNQISGLRVAVSVDGRSVEPTRVILRPVTPRYFETTGIPLTEGRAFAESDRQAAPAVAIVNAAFVREVLGAGTAPGVRIRIDLSDAPVAIVGVAADVTPSGEADRPALYVPADQIAIAGGSLLVRTRDDPEATIPQLATRLRAVAPALAADRIHVVSDSVAAGRAIVRFNTQLAATFAGLALLLAAIGVYGLTAGEVAARWRELAVRLALGASKRIAFWAVLRRAVSALAIGVAVGVTAMLAIGRSITTLLPGVAPADPFTLLAAPLILAGVGIVAGSLAARRVLSADPAATLRGE